METRPDLRTAIVPADDGKPPPPSSKNKKKRRAMSFLRAAVFMWRRRGSGKRGKATLQIEAAAASAGMLNMVVGSMRPLHVNGGESPPHVETSAALTLALPGFAETRPVPSPSPSPSPAYSDRFDDAPGRHSSVSCEGSSRYSSALDLQELEKGEEACDRHGDSEIDHYDADGGDEMIDVKAEEFIARFYEQMKIQNYDETARGYPHGRSW